MFETRWSAYVLTEDQCKQCSTMWFILLKEIKAITQQGTRFTHYLTHNVIFNELAIFSLYWPLILQHHVLNRFLVVLHHISSISAGSQLSFSRPNRWAWPCLGLPLLPTCFCLRTGSKKFWIQAITHISVWHTKEITYNAITFKVTLLTSVDIFVRCTEINNGTLGQAL